MGYRIEEVNEIKNTNDIGLGVSFATGDRLFSSIYTTIEQTRENLKTLLLTSTGERYMQPAFGTDLLRLLFEPSTVELKMQITDIIQRAINYWLPYIDVQNIDVKTAEDEPYLSYDVQISITYSVSNFSTDTITLTAFDGNLTIQ